MGYETKIYVVNKYDFDRGEFKSGGIIASMDLCKMGEGEFESLRSESVGKEKMSLWAFNPDRQQEAVELLRQLAECESLKSLNLEVIDKEKINKLSNDIEDGVITKDCYGDYLGVMLVPDVIEALKADCKNGEYRRFAWAIAMLESIWETSSEYERQNLRVISYGH
jgi:anti-sigma28 factor (negative regulator of flagellin synthesis)